MIRTPSFLPNTILYYYNSTRFAPPLHSLPMSRRKELLIAHKSRSKSGIFSTDLLSSCRSSPTPLWPFWQNALYSLFSSLRAMELEKAISLRHTHLVLSRSIFLPPIIFSFFLQNHCTGYNRTETFHTLKITFLKIDFLEIAQLMIPREWDGGGCIQRVQPGMIKLFRRIAPRNNIYPKITPAPIGSPVLLDPKMCGRSLTFHKCGNIDIDT